MQRRVTRTVFEVHIRLVRQQHLGNGLVTFLGGQIQRCAGSIVDIGSTVREENHHLLMALNHGRVEGGVAPKVLAIHNRLVIQQEFGDGQIVRAGCIHQWELSWPVWPLIRSGLSLIIA